MELSRADAVMKIIITACMELKQEEAAVVGTRGKVSHDWFAVLGVEGGWTVHYSQENYMAHPVTGVRFRYSITPEFFEVASACGDRVILSGLKSKAGKLLNGMKGSVGKVLPNGRISVKVDVRKMKSISSHNMILC